MQTNPFAQNTENNLSIWQTDALHLCRFNGNLLHQQNNKKQYIQHTVAAVAAAIDA